MRSALSVQFPKHLTLLALVTLLPGVAAMSACAGDPVIPAVTPALHQSTWATWKASRATFLKTPGRPVSYTGLEWITQGASTIGSDSTNMIVLSGRDVPALLGRLVRDGNRVRFEPADSTVLRALRVDSQPATAGWLRADTDSGGASRVEIGTGGFRIVRRVDSVGVRTWDSDLAAAEGIAPLQYFPLDSAWRVAGRLMPAARPETIAVPTTAGVGEIHIILGTVRFALGGEERALTAMAGNGPLDLYFSFSDETSGEETYGFRFLHAAIDSATKAVVMDFNFAYNPDCAFSAFTTCPLPPQENRLPARITAGEKVAVHVKDAPGPKIPTVAK